MARLIRSRGNPGNTQLMKRQDAEGRRGESDDDVETMMAPK